MPRHVDITGQTFHYLTALGRVGNTGPHATYLCRCVCGTEVPVMAYKLTQGKKQSCGCKRSETRRKAATKHGHAQSGKPSREYQTWTGMKRRCYNPNCREYRYYGAKGVRVCDRWKDSFENFLEDMGVRPPGRMSLDRIDPKGDYTPDNCRWLPLSANISRAHKPKDSMDEAMEYVLEVLNSVC